MSLGENVYYTVERMLCPAPLEVAGLDLNASALVNDLLAQGVPRCLLTQYQGDIVFQALVGLSGVPRPHQRGIEPIDGVLDGFLAGELLFVKGKVDYKGYEGVGGAQIPRGVDERMPGQDVYQV